MVDAIVSVRMRSSFVQKLKELSRENHFLDVSEEVRSIVRIKAREYHLKMGLQKEQAPGQKPVDYKKENVVKEELVKRLKEMIRELEHEE